MTTLTPNGDIAPLPDEYIDTVLETIVLMRFQTEVFRRFCIEIRENSKLYILASYSFGMASFHLSCMLMEKSASVDYILLSNWKENQDVQVEAQVHQLLMSLYNKPEIQLLSTLLDQLTSVLEYMQEYIEDTHIVSLHDKLSQNHALSELCAAKYHLTNRLTELKNTTHAQA